MKVGIICAGDRELKPFLSHIKDCKITKKAMLTFYEGEINNVNIVTLFCGVCKTNAAIATQILIDTYKADIIINGGTAGGMDDLLEIFDTVISTEVAHHDIHKSILTEFHPWLPSIYFKADDTLINLSKKAVSRLPLNKVYFGRMITGESFIVDEGRDNINLSFKPLSVDMETASIAQTCYINNIPFISIRCITDTAKHSGEENFDKNCIVASTISKDIILELLTELKNFYKQKL